MKKIISLILLVAMLMNIFACQNTSLNDANDVNNDLLTQIKDKATIVIAMEGTWAPWTYHDENDKLVGFDTEVSEAIAKKLGVNPVYIEGKWDGLFAGLDSARYDIVVNGVEVTDERKEKYDFSIPYAYMKTALIVRKDNDSIHSFEDLNGKVTANSINSTYMNLAESLGAKVEGVESLDETLELVLSGRVDATLNADVSFYDYMNVHKDAPLKIVALSDDATDVSIPMRKGVNSNLLREEIDKAINELRQDGTLTNISMKYFNKDITK